MNKETNNNVIRFYKNYSTKNKRFFVSGKGANDKYFSLGLRPETRESGLYLNNSLFEKGIDIEKSKLELLEKDNKDCNILVFKTPEDEHQYTITKEDIDKRKNNDIAKKNFDAHAFAKDLIDFLNIKLDELDEKDKYATIRALLVEDEKLTPISEEDLPF